MRARVHVMPKPGVLDPQGKAIENALAQMGFDLVVDVRQGKYLELELNETDAETAKKQVNTMCAQLLANTVIEDYSIEID